MIPESVTFRTLLITSTKSLIVLSEISEHVKILELNVEYREIIKSIVRSGK